MTEQYLSNDINAEAQLTIITQYIDSILESELRDFDIPDINCLSLIGTAGTPTTLAAIELKLDPYDSLKVNGFILSRETIVRIVNMLRAMTREERLCVPGLEKGREDLIIPGALTVLSTMNRFSKDSLIVSDEGLLEGVLYTLCGR